MHISKSPVVSQGEACVQADLAQCRRTHSNDSAGQAPPCDTSALEDAGSLWVTLPSHQGWERLKLSNPGALKGGGWMAACFVTRSTNAE